MEKNDFNYKKPDWEGLAKGIEKISRDGVKMAWGNHMTILITKAVQRDKYGFYFYQKN